MSPELKESNDEESLGKAVKDVVWSRDTIGSGRVGPEITRCSLDSKEKAPFLVLLYSIVSGLIRQLEREEGKRSIRRI